MLKIFGAILTIVSALATPVIALADNPVAAQLSISSSWGKTLNPAGVIPNDGFAAYYFDRNRPTRAIFQENIKDVAIKYSWSDFHSIKSENFGAYWVGKLKFDKPATKQISISQSWAKSRIFIDGRIVFDDKNTSKSFVYDFSPGEHVMEVEYINNWHTVEYKVTIDDKRTLLTETEVAQYFMNNKSDDADLYYVSMYESRAKDTSVTVVLPASDKPLILWLASYEAIDWRISTTATVSSVIVGSFNPGSRVSGEGSAPISYLKRNWSGIVNETRRCSCSAGNFHCESKTGLEDVAEKLQSITNRPLTGYATTYSADGLTTKPYDATAVGRLELRRKDELAGQTSCRQRADPDFDTLMK
ncbi:MULTISPECIES: hypothetical protein [unclassified Beijerinckia]|uniref:hypothetical protein n=1 Tax=unclassified Beijerinckia TaxID=2638183 RepID=UPI00089C27B2|nr:MULTISPECIES: hypothetical protein [unclassified Beijerinckia]MDH7794988.1 hypothetical protein [Beijerinckia sp. GAS462]SEB83019.1 PA14 domain-containing protein [Beijerinckia sp. 28-YEA-48]